MLVLCNLDRMYLGKQLLPCTITVSCCIYTRLQNFSQSTQASQLYSTTMRREKADNSCLPRKDILRLKRELTCTQYFLCVGLPSHKESLLHKTKLFPPQSLGFPCCRYETSGHLRSLWSELNTVRPLFRRHRLN